MHHLHPRSRTTSTLFTTTLAISFLVVGIPHLLPCPVDRRQFADSYETADGRIMRRRRRKDALEEDTTENTVDSSDDVTATGRPKQHCPIPRPTGIVGQIMGFKDEERLRPTEVVVQPLASRSKKQVSKGNDDTT